MPILAFLLALFLATPAWADTFGPGYREIQEEGTAVTPRRQKVNFIGAAATAADDAANNRTNITITAGSGGNSFETISVPAGTNPVADSSTDTLTITETSPLVVTGTAATDTIDITWSSVDLGADGTIQANAVALTTDTTGDYVAGVADGTGIDGTASGEGSTYTPTLDLTEISSVTFGAGAFTNLAFNSATAAWEIAIETGLFRIVNTTTGNVLFRSTAAGAMQVVGQLITEGGAVLNGTIDASGAVSFAIPTATLLTMSANGQIGLENYYDRLVVRGGSNRSGQIPSGTKVAIPLLRTFTKSIMFPDLVQAEQDAPLLLRFPAVSYPHGFQITYLAVESKTNVTFSYNLEEWTSPTDAAPSTITAVAFTSQTFKDFTSFSDAAIAAGSEIRLDLDTTDHSEVGITVVGYAKTS